MSTLVIVGFILAPTMYHQVTDAIPVAPPQAQQELGQLVGRLDNILLLQICAGIMFTVAIVIGLKARRADPGFHKRMMMIAPAMAIGAAFARIQWLPHTIPDAPTSILVYQIVALLPLLAWDIIRNRRVHRAFLVLAALYVPLALVIETLWDTPWWHQTARAIMGA